MVRTFAAADIGSNTAHLLVAATDGGLVMRLENLNEWIPLGEVVARTGEIPREIGEALVHAMKEFRRVAESRKADGFYVFATEAMRVARNSEAVVRAIRREAGVAVDVVSAEREAEFGLRGVGLDTRHAGAGLLVEVGGGSAQIGRLEGRRLTERVSLPLGTGRVIATANIVQPAPEVAVAAARSYVRESLSGSAFAGGNGLAVLSGGVARGLWRALHPDGEKHLYPWEIAYLSRAAARLPVDRIVSRFSVKARRAGTLLPGAIVYEEIMAHFGIEEAIVSEFGVREGAVLEMAAGNVPLRTGAK